MLKGADKMAKNDQKCWSQPGFEPGAFQREKKVRNFRLKLYHCATEADTLTLLFYENQSICTYSLLNKSRTWLIQVELGTQNAKNANISWTNCSN